MSKVFEALLRQQQQEQNGGAARDPLAEETGTPDESDGDTPFELPSVIGAPIGPRSNEGALFPSFNPTPQNDSPKPNVQHHASPQPAALTPVNGKHKTEHKPEPARPAAAVARGASERLRNAAPVIRRTEPELPVQQQPEPAVEPPIRNAQSEIRNPAKQQREIHVEPIAKSRLHPRLVLLTQPHAPECEQYRTLRTQLFHAAEKKSLQIVTITSTLAGEGKTSTAINLALAIAQSKEKRVLIIDGDLRRPNVAAYLGARVKTGLGEILTGDGEALDSIFTLEGLELYVLPVSREAANPTELLSSERFSEMLAELRRYFDFILIDSPPVMPFADTRLLANHSDALVLVVRAGLAPYETVEKAIEALPAAKMLGVVLNGAEHGRETGYYDY
ncbi:MAG TPA: polysaccharide biosynthesis tyrosine autokinase, partial [Blastocatellia bacterium]|nr:polysaccharide biosynthesis tyrosine autokinase [Blastocatellia bacterium]